MSRTPEARVERAAVSINAIFAIILDDPNVSVESKRTLLREQIEHAEQDLRNLDAT